jgi:hypothetical protein
MGTGVTGSGRHQVSVSHRRFSKQFELCVLIRGSVADEEEGEWEVSHFAGVVKRRACGREGVCCRVGRIEAGDVAGCEQVAEAVVSGAGRAEGVQ